MLAATALMAALLSWAGGHFDWTAMRAQPWLRAGLLAATLVAAAGVYFGALRIAGMPLRHFVTR